MAIDERHEIEPRTGFAVDKDSGHIVRLMQAPAARIDGDHEYPAWVVPHESQIVRKQLEGAPDHVSTPGFVDFHVNRVDGGVTVLVKDADEEARATSVFEPDGKPATGVFAQAGTDDGVLREVHSDVEQIKREEAEALNRKIKSDQEQLERDEAARRVAANEGLSDREREAAEQLAADERARSAVIAQS